MTEQAKVTTAAGIVGAATLISRVLGFVRDAAIAWFLGAGMGADAFLVAFRIPNLFRRLFAEGSLSMAFVPVFTETLAHNGKDDAYHLARSGLKFVAMIMTGVAGIGMLCAPLLVRILAPGFSDIAVKFDLTTSLVRIMFPFIVFVCLTAICMAILNTLDHFAAPALAPALLNIAMIGSIFLIGRHVKTPEIALAIGVLIGGVLQLALQIPFLIKRQFSLFRHADVFHPGMKKIGKFLIPVVLGASVFQINSLIGTFLASFLKQGSVAYLYYADRLVQFPLGLFAVAASTAVLPAFSRYAAQHDMEALRDTFVYSVKTISFFTIPAMIGLIILREPIIALLFQRGAFDSQSTHLTGNALLYYSCGIWAFSLIQILVSMFYALHDTRTPMAMAAVSIAANLMIGIVLMPHLQHGGLALAMSLAAMIQLSLLAWAVREKLGNPDWRSIGVSLGKSAISALIMGGIVMSMSRVVFVQASDSTIRLFLGVVGCVTIGVIMYGVSAFLVKSPELIRGLSIIKEMGIRRS